MASNLNQELQNKYPHLEISVLKYSDTMKDNDSKRIDSEFFKKEYLFLLDRLKEIGFKTLSEISNTYELHSNGAFADIYNILHDSKPKKVKYIEAKNISDFFIEGETDFISEEAHKSLSKTITKFGDILTSRTGKIGGAAFVFKNWENCNTNQNIVNIRINDEKFNKYYVALFLNTKFGIMQFEKSSTGNVQPWLNLTLLRKVKIPIFPLEFQQQIEQMVRQSHDCLEQSKGLYREAEILLYEEIGLDLNDPLSSIQPLSNRLNVSVQTLKQSFLATGRLDSEYYQQKYDDIENLIKNYHNGYMRLKDIGNFANGSLISEDFYVEKAKRAYIRIKELSFNSPIKIEESVYIDDNFEAKNETAVKENDFIIATIGNTIGKVNLVPKELSGSFISNNTSKFSLFDKNIMPEFLELLLRSVIVQEQIQRDFTQTAQPKISNYSLENILIPKFSLKIQESIAKNLQKSFDLRSEAKNLLKNAKERVENSIIVGGGVTPRYLFAEVKILLKKARYFYRLATWQIYEELFSASNRDKFSHLNINTRSLSQSLNATGRLDSEYYQQKYDLMEKQIKKNGFKTLEEICSLINYGSVPKSPYSETDTGVPYIKGLNLKNLQIDETKLDRITNTEDLNSRFFTKENDIVISQMGTVGDVGVVSKEQENYIFASFTIRVRLKNIDEFNPYFVALYIQNIAKEWYLYRNIAQASVRQNTDLPTIKNLYVPLISYEKQTQIAEKIKQSFTLRNKANKLLQQAKSKVETAIEHGLAI